MCYSIFKFFFLMILVQDSLLSNLNHNYTLKIMSVTFILMGVMFN